MPAPEKLSFRDRIASFFGRSSSEAGLEHDREPSNALLNANEHKLSEHLQSDPSLRQELSRAGQRTAPESGPARDADDSRSGPKPSVAERIEQRLERDTREPDKTREPQGREERHEPKSIQDRLQDLANRETRPEEMIRERQQERERDRERGGYER